MHACCSDGSFVVLCECWCGADNSLSLRSCGKPAAKGPMRRYALGPDRYGPGVFATTGPVLPKGEHRGNIEIGRESAAWPLGEESRVHILTKVFVLFAAVLSIMLSALTISYTINTDQIVSNYNDALEQADTARSSLAAQTARHGMVLDEKNGEISGLRAQLSATTNTMRDIERGAAQLQTDLRTAQADKAAADRSVQGALEATKAQTYIIDAYKNEVSTLRDNELKAREMMLALEERVSNLVSQSEVQEATIRALRETIASIQQGGDRGGSGEVNLTTAAPIPGPLVRGSVQSVAFDSETGRNIVQINLGENDRMRRNTRVFIVRGSEFIADLVITRTDLNVSTGVVVNLRPGAIVRQGDTIKTRLDQ